MKKIAAILLTVLMVISLTACAGGDKPAEEKTSEAGTTAENASTGSGSKENAPAEVIPEPEGDEGTSETTPENEPAGSEPVNESEGGKILVAYFSATNTTEGVAEQIADCLSADLYEIVPEQPYTDADLNYHDDNSRSTIEMNDPSARPAISGSVEDMEQYSIIFIGYPIWWGEAPRIMNTFVESYDFSGKTVVPFCTSGGSGGRFQRNESGSTDGWRHMAFRHTSEWGKLP